MKRKDSGVAVVVAFVIILAVIAVIVGVWALFGIPGQVHAAGEAAVSESERAFTDYKIELEALQNSNTSGVNVSVMMPLGGAAAPGTLRLETAGALGLINDTENFVIDGGIYADGRFAWIQRLVSDVGIVGTQVGFEANGIFRNDRGMASWSVPLNLTLWNDTSSAAGGELHVRLNAATILGEVNLGGTGSIPLNTYYTGDNVTVNTTNRTQSLAYVSPYEWDANLWYSQFYEAVEAYKAKNAFPANTSVEITKGSLMNMYAVWMNVSTANAGHEEHTIEMHVPGYNAQAVESYIVVVPTYHTLNVSALNEGGSIRYNGQDVTNQTVRIREGDEPTFSISLNSGKKIKEVKINGTPLPEVVHTYTFRPVMDDNQKIDVEFEDAPTWQITVTVGAGGTIMYKGTTVTGGSSRIFNVIEGDSATFTISANEGYVIDSVTVDGVSQGKRSSYTFPDVRECHEINATFKPVEEGKVAITMSVNQGATGGTISASGHTTSSSTSFEVTKGSNVEFTIQPYQGYSIADIKVNGESVGISPSYTLTNVQDPQTVVEASFKAHITISDYKRHSGRYYITITPSNTTDIRITEVKVPVFILAFFGLAYDLEQEPGTYVWSFDPLLFDAYDTASIIIRGNGFDQINIARYSINSNPIIWDIYIDA